MTLSIYIYICKLHIIEAIPPVEKISKITAEKIYHKKKKKRRDTEKKLSDEL
jgi:1,2-phenylacetyl-CoA epoxidase PaaB subunit